MCVKDRSSKSIANQLNMQNYGINLFWLWRPQFLLHKVCIANFSRPKINKMCIHYIFVNITTLFYLTQLSINKPSCSDLKQNSTLPNCILCTLGSKEWIVIKIMSMQMTFFFISSLNANWIIMMQWSIEWQLGTGLLD